MYLAIDGGGTKTEYLLLDEQFREKAHFLGGCINHDFLPDGWQGTRREIENGIARLAEQCAGAEERIQDVVVGASGIDTAVAPAHAGADPGRSEDPAVSGVQ